MNPVYHAQLLHPSRTINERLAQAAHIIEPWFQDQWFKHTPALYASMDLRSSHYKLAPVDTNLFPAGFNNLSAAGHTQCAQALSRYLKRYYPNARNVMILPESHTRNRYYLENVAVLNAIIQKAGYDAKIAMLPGHCQTPNTLYSASGAPLNYACIQREGRRLFADHFVPDIIVSNNDLTQGLPDLLQAIDQPVIPSPYLGWWQRSKTAHFQHYAQLSEILCEAIDLDPWLITPICQWHPAVDFNDANSVEPLKALAQDLFDQINARYQAYGINERPFLAIKADKGTYGMGVIMIDDPNDLNRLNRKQRNRMGHIKGGQPIHRLFIQEGIPAQTQLNDAVAEPVIYTIDTAVVGGFYRYHDKQGSKSNLNSPGMHFQSMDSAMAQRIEPSDTQFYAYHVVARLALLAAARENQALKSGEG